MTPSIRAMKKKWPSAYITVASTVYCSTLLQNNPFCGTAVYPVDSNLLDSADAILGLERVIELNEEGKTIHAVDLFAKAMSVELESKHCEYYFAPHEKVWAAKTYPRIPGFKRIGLQMRASSEVRCYPQHRLQELIERICKKGHELYIFGNPGQEKIDCKVPGWRIINLTEQQLTFRESAAVLDTCDGVIAPDSALCHLSGALNKPCVALYGSYPWQLRTIHHPSIRAIQGNGECKNCFHHPIYEEWPAGKPCAKAGFCTVLESIEPQRIVSLIESKI
jgi:ADP-heptose:LPS heptosyltransferase